MQSAKKMSTPVLRNTHKSKLMWVIEKKNKRYLKLQKKVIINKIKKTIKKK